MSVDVSFSLLNCPEFFVTLAAITVCALPTAL
jgi:hypothetical protein